MLHDIDSKGLPQQRISMYIYQRSLFDATPKVSVLLTKKFAFEKKEEN